MVLSARYAGVVRALVVRTARCVRSDFMRNVAPIRARCAARDRVRNVVQLTGSSCRVALCRCGTLMRVASNRRLRAAEPAAVADAAARRARSGRFWLLEAGKALSRSIGAAQLSGNPLGGGSSKLCLICERCPFILLVGR